MKKIVGLILLAVMVLIAVPAKSQIKFGIKGGLNISSVHFNKDLVGKDNVTGFNIGPIVEVMAPIMGVGFDADILYSQRGIGVKSEKDIKNDYIDVPVNLKWKFGLPIIKGYLAAGPYVGFRVGGDKLWDIPGSVALLCLFKHRRQLLFIKMMTMCHKDIQISLCDHRIVCHNREF